MASVKRSRAAFEADLQARQSPYALYGTPLPPLDPAVRDDGSYVPVWKQEVTDDRGRKRLHGAFTGGFSAGYFNTVGSKEGWTPSTFVSSRKNRATKQDNDGGHASASAPLQQRPEDFMDEEDLREAEEARQLQTNESFAGLGSTWEDQNRRGALMDLLMPAGETIGVKLLKRMGWREGQGIGPKVRRKADLGDRAAMADGPEETHLFAPPNPPMITFERKADRKGLGFQGEARLGVDSATATANAKTFRPGNNDSDEDSGPSLALTLGRKKKKKESKRGGFGVGILNDTGSDDEDPYSMGPQISYNKTLGGDRKKTKSKPALASANPLLNTKPVFISKKAAAAKAEAGRCYDGRPPLEGFVLASQTKYTSTEDDAKYAPPEVPEGWVSSKAVAVTTENTDYQSTADAAKASKLDAQTRAALLGEAQLPGKSVFDFLTPSARERIAAASGKSDLPTARGEPAPKGYVPLTIEEQKKDLWDQVPKLDKEVAAQALARGGGSGGWMPYAEDEHKRSRYRGYLELRAGLRQDLPSKPPDMSTNDWITELHEFARAAQVFKPMSGMMASRFTSSSSNSASKPSDPDNNNNTSLLNKPGSKPADPAEVAASMGMFGPMTRSVRDFYPTRLLCKRFNVKPPAHVQIDPGEGGPDSGSGRYQADTANASSSSSSFSSSSRLDLVSRDVMNQLMIESGGGAMAFASSSSPSTTAIDGENSGADVGATSMPPLLPGEVLKPAPVVVDVERNDALEAERPGDAVFKAIFGSDDEDDD